MYFCKWTIFSPISVWLFHKINKNRWVQYRRRGQWRLVGSGRRCCTDFSSEGVIERNRRLSRMQRGWSDIISERSESRGGSGRLSLCGWWICRGSRSQGNAWSRSREGSNTYRFSSWGRYAMRSRRRTINFWTDTPCKSSQQHIDQKIKLNTTKGARRESCAPLSDQSWQIRVDKWTTRCYLVYRTTTCYHNGVCAGRPWTSGVGR